ncbi:hypothetical protein Bpfe_030149, partial [Biomphalaria pfeifferi]
RESPMSLLTPRTSRSTVFPVFPVTLKFKRKAEHDAEYFNSSDRIKSVHHQAREHNWRKDGGNVRRVT